MSLVFVWVCGFVSKPWWGASSRSHPATLTDIIENVVISVVVVVIFALLIWRRLRMCTTVSADLITVRGLRTRVFPVASVVELIEPGGATRPTVWLTRKNRSRLSLPGTKMTDVEDISSLTGIPHRPRTPLDP